MERVFPDIILMVRTSLIESRHGSDLRQKHLEGGAIFPQNTDGVLSAEQPQKFRRDSFCRNTRKHPAALQYGGGSGFLQRKRQNGRKAQGAQNAQAVFLKAPLRRADAADSAQGEIVLAAEKIDKPAVPCQRVDGEITPGQILAQAAGKMDGLRMPVIRILSVHPEGCDFQRQARKQYGDSAVLFSLPGEGPGGEKFGGFLRQSGGGNVPVMGRKSQEGVAHTAAHQIGLESCFVQRVECLFDRFRHIWPHAIPPPVLPSGSGRCEHRPESIPAMTL